MVKKVTTLGGLLAVLLLTWIPITSFALGLGPITMRSALNQPLQAEIEIHSAQPGDLDGLAVRLASDEDFARVNVDRSSFLGRILFKVQLRNDGSPYILLSTKEPVTEPYLDFLIEARWARGRALKEYTVLVDPPVLTEETPAPVQQSATAPVFSKPVPQTSRPVRSAPTPQRESVQQQARQPAPKRVATPTRRPAPQVAAGDNSYRVQRNDTLSEIAHKMRPDGTSVNQMMMALLKANPSAFYNNNINQLKAGYVLRLDDAEEAAANISRREANAAVREQMAAWREGRPTRLVQQTEPDETQAGEDSAASTSKGGSKVASTADESARLKLVTPGQEGAGSGSGSDSGNKSASKLQQELLLATEALDANRAETDELKTRLADLEDQLASMQRLINLKDEEMMSLQKSLKDGQPVAEQQAEAPKAKPEEAAKPKPAPAPAEEGSVVDSLLSDTTMLGLVAILVLGVVAWLVIRRRKMQEGFQESILNVGMADSVARADSTMPGESNMVSDFAMSGMEPIQTDTADVDPISEADVYLAYGRHTQAEDIIRQALQKTPDRLDLHAKLLEVMHAANNRAGFEAQAQVLYDKLGGDESNDIWARAAALGSQIAPNNPLFGGDMDNSMSGSPDLVGSVGDVTADEEDLLDFDFDEDDSFEVAADSAKNKSSSSDDDLDFDVSALDFDLGDDDAADNAMSSIDAMDANDDNSIDFDLTDDGELEIASTSSRKTANQHEELLSLDDDEDHIDLDALELESSHTSAKANSGLSLVEGTSGGSELSLEDTDFDMELDLDEDVPAANNKVVALDSLGGDDSLGDDIFADVDEIGTKLDLAKAYVDMGDSDGARSILDEVLEEGDDSQKQQAEQLLQQMG